MMLAWGAEEVFTKWPRTKPAIAAFAVISCAACAAIAWKQTTYWHDTKPYSPAQSTRPDLMDGTYVIPAYIAQTGTVKAIDHFQTALRITRTTAKRKAISATDGGRRIVAQLPFRILRQPSA